MLEINDGSFATEVEGSDIPVVVDFSATWCGPCKRLKPIIEELAGEYEGKVKIVGFDIDASPNTPAKFGIRSVPTLLFFKGGEPVDQAVGLLPKNQLKAKIEALV